METKVAPLIIGGIVPAIFYGLAGFLQKWSAREAGSASSYLIGFGAATVIAGVVFRALLSETASSGRSFLISLLAGLVFALGAGLISMTLLRYDAAVSQLSPLYNMNVLITVALGLLLFKEFRDIQAARVLLGTALVLVGGWLVSSA